ncbi:nitrate/trimethylamine N-oxide reductase NapE/TorE [Rodentibacter heidelbergensis]|uniref:Nitrate/trimethylamine N-oxide reductase NapE/TorE n=1 Tax=Rodentibacter heidelbergensis TaxID=1908258 RepID=A0A1V3I9L1_9PAST|nr:nitrate/trimethylamine N-oxide reductase NapE/TorE [Rodentibacter heidelbergensis]OOF36351.1 nitrate/trimethylamine N-oxide reductase NapE/TorE [Rodentibacter heidelbergensis]
MEHLNTTSLSSEIGKLLLLLFVILPLGMTIFIGAYGFVVWLLQMFVIGLPGV